MMRAGPLLAVLACVASPSDTTPVHLEIVARPLVQQRLEAVPRKLADRKTALEASFQEVGCGQERFTEQRVPGSKAPNLVCTLAGTTESEIVVGGHLDSIESGMGAVDDWSGAALLPSLYQSLKATPRRHRFVFVGFAAEEVGLVGSHEFVKKLSPDELHRIHAMINLECLGLGPARVWASRADPALLDAYSKVASSLHLEALGMNVDGAGDDDSHPFLTAKVPVLTIHSLTHATLPILHNKRDNLTAINADDYYNSYRLVATYLAYLDGAIE
jgi:aminopeptidase-like protein